MRKAGRFIAFETAQHALDTGHIHGDFGTHKASNCHADAGPHRQPAAHEKCRRRETHARDQQHTRHGVKRLTRFMKSTLGLLVCLSIQFFFHPTKVLMRCDGLMTWVFMKPSIAILMLHFRRLFDLEQIPAAQETISVIHIRMVAALHLPAREKRLHRRVDCSNIASLPLRRPGLRRAGLDQWNDA